MSDLMSSPSISALPVYRSMHFNTTCEWNECYHGRLFLHPDFRLQLYTPGHRVPGSHRMPGERVQDSYVQDVGQQDASKLQVLPGGG